MSKSKSCMNLSLNLTNAISFIITDTSRNQTRTIQARLLPCYIILEFHHSSGVIRHLHYNNLLPHYSTI